MECSPGHGMQKMMLKWYRMQHQDTHHYKARTGAYIIPCLVLPPRMHAVPFDLMENVHLTASEFRITRVHSPVSLYSYPGVSLESLLVLRIIEAC